MPAPKVTVLVPVFNGARFLPECFDSILAQDFADMEILVGDDGSTDDSLAWVQKYAARDPRIRWWKNPRNLGLSANFNCCLQAAKGEYIKYVLQDDKLLSPATVRLMAEALDKNPATALVGSASLLLDEHSQVTGSRDYYKPGCQSGRQIMRNCLEESANRIGEPTVVMFRRAQAGRGFCGRYRQLVDQEMWFHLLSQGDFFYLAEPLCAFRQHSRQQTAINRNNIASGTEEVMLLKDCLRQPWSRQVITRRLLFANIYLLRRRKDAGVREFVGELKRRIGPGWYWFYWTHRKLIGPFKKLARWYKKRMMRRQSTSP